MEFYRPSAYRTSSGKINLGISFFRKKRSHHKKGCSHLVCKSKRNLSGSEFRHINVQSTIFVNGNFTTQKVQDILHYSYIQKLRNFPDFACLSRKYCGRHKWQDRILCATNLHFSVQRPTILNQKLCHDSLPIYPLITVSSFPQCICRRYSFPLPVLSHRCFHRRCKQVHTSSA